MATKPFKPLAVLDGQLADAPHNIYHRNAVTAAGQAVAWAVMCGLELIKIRKQVGHGEWLPWIKKNCDFTERTAYRYIGVAEGVKAKKLNLTSMSNLLGAAPSNLTIDQRNELLQAVHKATDGETLQQLYLDFGIIKAPQGSGATGGARPHPKKAFDPNRDPEMEKAIDLCAPVIQQMAFCLMERTWVHLPDHGEFSRQRLLDLCIQLSRELKDAQPKRSAK
jgi:hypothetical protein